MLLDNCYYNDEYKDTYKDTYIMNQSKILIICLDNDSTCDVPYKRWCLVKYIENSRQMII